MPKMSQKQIDALVTAAFYRQCCNVTIPIMDLSKIMHAGREAVKAGADVDEAVRTAAQQYATA